MMDASQDCGRQPRSGVSRPSVADLPADSSEAHFADAIGTTGQQENIDTLFVAAERQTLAYQHLPSASQTALAIIGCSDTKHCYCNVTVRSRRNTHQHRQMRPSGRDKVARLFR